MRDRPTGAELLELAREVLLAKLVPLLPEEQRADAALVARSMAIAARELSYGEASFDPCRALLEVLYGAGDGETLLRRLAADIRAGAYDRPGASREAVRRLLWAVTRQKLRESNPECLAASGQD